MCDPTRPGCRVRYSGRVRYPIQQCVAAAAVERGAYRRSEGDASECNSDVLTFELSSASQVAFAADVRETRSSEEHSKVQGYLLRNKGTQTASLLLLLRTKSQSTAALPDVPSSSTCQVER